MTGESHYKEERVAVGRRRPPEESHYKEGRAKDVPGFTRTWTPAEPDNHKREKSPPVAHVRTNKNHDESRDLHASIDSLDQVNEYYE
eukprot:1999988-Pyramimonas_sp.AAC.1